MTSRQKARLAASCAALLAWSTAVAAESRAEFNYRRLFSGEIQFAELSAQERLEIIELDRLLRSRAKDRENETERCWRRELDRNGSPSLLALQLIELRCGQRPGAVETGDQK